MTVAVVAAIIGSMSLTSCIGSFSLTHKLLSWNQRISNKFVNELVFIGFWILPVYEVSALADILVINAIEFWSGNKPVAKSTKTVEGKNGSYLVQCDGRGYTITSKADGKSVRLDYDAATQEWSTVIGGKKTVFLGFVDDTHVKVPGMAGDYQTVELSESGVYAYQQTAAGCQLAAR